MSTNRVDFGAACVLALLGLGLLVTNDARAEGAFIGGSLGWSRIDYDTGFYDSLVRTQAATIGDTVALSSASSRQGSSGWWVNAGYWLGPSFGAEIAYLHLDALTYDVKGSVLPAGAGGTISATAHVSAQGPALSLIGRLPLTSALEVDARAGDYYANAKLGTDILFQTATHGASYSSSASSLLLGAGLSYAVTSHWSMRLDYLHVNKAGDARLGTLNASLVTAGVSFTF